MNKFYIKKDQDLTNNFSLSLNNDGERTKHRKLRDGEVKSDTKAVNQRKKEGRKEGKEEEEINTRTFIWKCEMCTIE